MRDTRDQRMRLDLYYDCVHSKAEPPHFRCLRIECRSSCCLWIVRAIASAEINNLLPGSDGTQVFTALGFGVLQARLAGPLRQPNQR